MKRMGRPSLASRDAKAAIVDDFLAWRTTDDIKRHAKSEHYDLYCQLAEMKWGFRFSSRTLKNWCAERRVDLVRAQCQGDPIAAGKLAEEAGRAAQVAAERSTEFLKLLGKSPTDGLTQKRGKVSTEQLLSESKRVTWDLLDAARRKALSETDGRELASLLEQVGQLVVSLDMINEPDDPR